MDEDYKVAFGLIMVAGDARSEAMLSIRSAKNGDISKAEELLKSAENRLLEAHQMQTDLIQQEAQGNKVDVNIILVHSQDHLTSAMVIIDLAKEFIDMYVEVLSLKDALRNPEGRKEKV